MAAAKVGHPRRPTDRGVGAEFHHASGDIAFACLFRLSSERRSDEFDHFG